MTIPDLPGRIVVVDDDATVADVVGRYLVRDGHTVECVHDGHEALRRIAAQPPDLVVLDLMLPGIDGLEVCRRLRERWPIPVVMLTALGDETDRLAGFEIGADDYVTKPFSPRELAMRVRSVLRRARGSGLPAAAEAGVIRDRDLSVDLSAHEVRLGERLIQLTSREYDLLVFLMRNPRKAFSREQLLAEVWSWSFGDTSTVTVHVRRLREKLEPDPTLPKRIVTVWGVGYRYEPDGGAGDGRLRGSVMNGIVLGGTAMGGAAVTHLATVADVIPGVQVGDLAHVSEWSAGIAVACAILGIIALKALARRSVGVLLAVVVGITVLSSLVSCGAIAELMLPGAGDRKVMLELLFVAGLSGLLVATFLGRTFTRASRTLLGAVQEVGESGIYTPPSRVLPAELAGLSEGLNAAHERLGNARAREKALETSRRELVAWVSHDLRTPLAGLRAMAEALEDQVVTDPREVSHYHSQIRRETDRLSAMIDDLFELSRIHAGTLRLSPRLVGLEDLVAEVVASTEPVARVKGIRLTGSAVRGMAVLIDTAEMGRAVRNLVTNAIRHTPPDGTIEVIGEIQAGQACVSVADECGGIPPGDLPRVFDVAFRGESARTPDPQGGGAGLGLSIARGIVDAHSGQLGVRNTGPGCQFTIKLPLARNGAPAVSRPAPTRATGAIHATR